MLLFEGIAVAKTIYLPDSTSSEYLPTVKIFSYNLDYNGNLVAQGFGSGTLITSSGVILTNNHVVQDLYDSSLTFDAFQICLTKSNEPQAPVCEFTASLIERDPQKDLALLRMDSKDVNGGSVNFDFYLPYDNGSNYEIGEAVTIVGYPDTGGKTITYTSGLISGIVSEGGVDYIKTDADISFGNSGGTAIDSEGNFIGVPTFIVGSYSSEALGYFFPVSDAKSWINSKKGSKVSQNEQAVKKLKSEISKYVSANKSGRYQNDYPPYEISLIDGWKFGNSLEGSFEGGTYSEIFGSAETTTIFPTERDDSSQLSIAISAQNFPYELSLQDLRSLYDDYLDDYGVTDSESTIEEVKFNGIYDALKVTNYEYDWYSYAYVNKVTYVMTYGDYAIALIYTYGDEEEDRISEVEEILATFSVNMGAVKSSVVNQVISANPLISVANPLFDAYLSDVSYEYEGVNYFGAVFGKKEDHDFTTSIYYNKFLDESYIGNFDLFKQEKIADMEEWYDLIAKGDFELDGHRGFYYVEQYDGYAGEETTYYADLFIQYDDTSYVTVYYSGDKEAYEKNLTDFESILRAIKLSNGGIGQYNLPSLSLSGENVSAVLSDIRNYVYEANIKSLNDALVFGENAPAEFKPADKVTRKDFVVWAIKMDSSLTSEFEEFKNAGVPHSFVDVDYNSEESAYFEFAKKKEAVNGFVVKGKTYFKPSGTLSLAAGLKIVFALYGYEVWQAPDYIPWYLPYLQLGYKEGLIPYGVTDTSYVLTRGEAAFLIDNASYASNYDFDNYYF